MTTTTTTTKRAGGDSRGSAHARRQRKRWMLSTWGTGKSCPCVHCGKRLTFATVEADRKIPGSKGGTYISSNVQPSCRQCNARRGDNMDWRPTS